MSSMPSVQPLRRPPLIFLVILILSLIDLAISSDYGTALAHAPLQYAAKEDHLTRASTGSVVLYSGTMPLLSVLAFLSMIWVHHLLCELAPLYSLTIATITTVGWITQVGIWLNCEVSGPTIAESVDSYCPQYSLQDQGAELARGRSGWKIGIAWVVIAAEMLYIGLCVYGIVKDRREARRGLPLQMENGSERELEGFGRLR